MPSPKTKKLVLTAVFLSVALMIGYLESLMPPVLPAVPYARLGLSNVAVLLAVFFVGAPHAYAIVVLKCFLIAAISGNFASMMFSVPAGLAALSVMLLILHTKKFSVPAASVFGALFHNAVQTAVASAVSKSPDIWIMLPYLAAFGMLAGFLTGCVSYVLVKHIPRH